MKNKTALFLLIICVLSFSFRSNPANSEAKFISGYTDGLISTYAIIEFNGIKYKTDESGSKTNMNLWNQLNDADKKQLMKYYWSPNTRKADFGSGSGEMASWANQDQGWTKLVDELKQKRANKNYPTLKAYYEKPLDMPMMPNVKCTDKVLNCELSKEASKLHAEIIANHQAGRVIYGKLVAIKWDQVGVAVKGISANLIPIIVDNFITSSITGISSVAINKMSPILASLYQVSDQVRQFAQNNPNEAAELIKKLDDLCDLMETDAETAMNFVEQDKQKLQALYEQLAMLCEQDVENNKKILEIKKAAVVEMMYTPIADTGLEIKSKAKTKEEREAEIRAKAEALNLKLNIEMHSLQKDTKNEFENIFKANGKTTFIAPVKGCEGIYPSSTASNCFKMYYSVKEIKDWQSDFKRIISETTANLEVKKRILAESIDARSTYIEKAKSIQSRKNELISKYGKYLFGVKIDHSVGGEYNAFIESLENEIPALEQSIANAESAEKIVNDGLEKRISREKSEVRPYGSLEANFINSLDQIKDAVYTMDRLYASEEFFIVDKRSHKTIINPSKIKEFKTRISLLKTDEEKDREIKAVTERLKALQKEQNHQIKRLILGQNNAMYDSFKLQEFLSAYTEGQVHSIEGFAKVKLDVKEVTGVSLKGIYYDIVKDWQGNDYNLWMAGGGQSLRWTLDPETFRIDMNVLIEQLNGRNQYYSYLDAILNEVKYHKASLLAMDDNSFRKKFNEYSNKSYNIIRDATNNGECNDQVNKNYANIINLLSEIQMVIITRERVKDAVPLLKQDIKDAEALLSSSNDDADYDGMISRLQYDTKDGSQAYFARNDTALAPLFEEINKLIPKLQNATKQVKEDAGTKNIQKIQEFYSNFKQAYESKNESQVVNFISNDWESSDGSNISDLESNLRRIFNIFDNINYNISNLNIVPTSDNTYKVSYDVEITGVNHERNLTHKEKSSVSEEIIIDHKGKIKLNKTLDGRFWYIE